MLNNLTFQLTKFPKALAFAIEAQTEEWQNGVGKYKDETFWKTKFYRNKYHVVSLCGGTAIIFDDNLISIHLRDKDREYDFNIDIQEFKSNTQRDKYHNLIIKALKQWSKMVYELRGIEPIEPKQVGDKWIM